jgi:hypothetical protein
MIQPNSGDEFHLAAIMQNLKTLANHLWRSRQTSPSRHCVSVG